MARRKNQGKASSSKGEPVDIPEAEQWRIIQESGILKQIPKDSKTTKAEDGVDDQGDDLSPFAEEVLNSMMLIIPMSFMLLLMDMYVTFAWSLVECAAFVTHPPQSGALPVWPATRISLHLPEQNASKCTKYATILLLLKCMELTVRQR